MGKRLSVRAYYITAGLSEMRETNAAVNVYFSVGRRTDKRILV